MMKQLAFLILWTCFSVPLMAQDTQLKQVELKLGAQSTVAEGYVSLNKAAVYTDIEGYYYSPDIDFIYLHGKTSGANLMVPSHDRGLRAFSKSLLSKVSAWKQRNPGIFIKLNGNDSEKIFSDAKTDADLIRLFNTNYTEIKNIEDYDPLLNGPGERLTHLEAGDVVLFKSGVKNLYAIGYISSIEHPGTRGTLTMVLKYKQ